MLKKCLLLIGIILLVFTNSCDYCEFEFSEEFFPLAVGNTWEYSELESGSNDKWEIIDIKTESGIGKYIVSWTDYDGEEYGQYVIYFIDERLYTSLPLSWYYDSQVNLEYVLVDFSMNKGDKFDMAFGEGIILSKNHNSIKIGIIPQSREDEVWDLEITFTRGKGIVEMYDWNWYHGKIQLINYSIN